MSVIPSPVALVVASLAESFPLPRRDFFEFDVQLMSMYPFVIPLADRDEVVRRVATALTTKITPVMQMQTIIPSKTANLTLSVVTFEHLAPHRGRNLPLDLFVTLAQGH
jgi:hypothetical protein